MSKSLVFKNTYKKVYKKFTKKYYLSQKYLAICSFFVSERANERFAQKN